MALGGTAGLVPAVSRAARPARSPGLESLLPTREARQGAQAASGCTEGTAEAAGPGRHHSRVPGRRPVTYANVGHSFLLRKGKLRLGEDKDWLPIITQL